MLRRNLIAVLAIAALALPAAAIAHHKEGHAKGKGDSKAQNVAYVFKGTYAGNSSVDVKQGNSRVRKGGYVGQTVAFDLTDARIVVADFNQDGEKNLDDVQIGDRVLVKARLPRQDPGDQPFDASRLVDQTHNPSDDS
ncbi:MAG TPA: hypothetical protein VNM89_07085 [Solirubrobacterales bacterium]|nr:hypothetical protein [Solirubrobacterales bacterium]